MSVNKFMHPRNIYKSRLNIKELFDKYPEFRKHVQLKLNGKLMINFKDINALRCLTTILFQKDFGLNVFIPEDHLIPTLSLRLNYILWLEDLLKCENEKNCNIRGIDIGTGATCVFPLLCAMKNSWKMLATEINECSVNIALQNVKNNNLENLIEVRKVHGKVYLVDVIDEKEEFDFCMCNPPFFNDETEISKTDRNKKPKESPCSTKIMNEVIAPGGELEFIKSIIQDSSMLKNRIKIYTTMIGHKSSVKTLIEELKNNNVKSFSQAQFCQGRTVRWGLAWTYSDIILNDFLPLSQTKNSKPMTWALTPKLNFKECVNVISDLLARLKMKFEIIEKYKRRCLWKIIAYENTWTGLRRKRREQHKVKIEKKIKNETTDIIINESQVTNDSNDNVMIEEQASESHLNENNKNVSQNLEILSRDDVKITSSIKRKIQQETEATDVKKFKSDVNKLTDICDNDSCVVEAFLSIKKVRNMDIQLQISRIQGIHEAPQQILQFLKNNLVKI